MVLRKEANLFTSQCLIWCKLLVMLHPSAFAYLVRITSVKSSSHSNLVCMLKGMAPTPHAIMPRSWRMWLEVSFTSVGLSTSSVYCKSTWSLSHYKSVCLLALIIAFCSLRWNWAKGLPKNYTFIAMWSWTFRPHSWIDGRLGLHGSMVTLWRACKCHTKLYLAI